jgi:hypothetical protein
LPALTSSSTSAATFATDLAVTELHGIAKLPPIIGAALFVIRAESGI